MYAINIIHKLPPGALKSQEIGTHISLCIILDVTYAGFVVFT